MRHPVREQQRQATFNITPMIDVVFLLIIFFLAASHLSRSESRESVDLPEATQSEEDDSNAANRLVITVTRDNRMHVAGNEVDLLLVEQLIDAGEVEHAGDFEVRVRADREVPYGEVKPILLACARSGVEDFLFMTIDKPE